MPTEHIHAEVLRGIADGKRFQYQGALGTEWFDGDHNSNPISHPHLNWRIKPASFLVNGVEIQAPESEAPKCGTKYYIPTLGSERFHFPGEWIGGDIDMSRLARGIVHLTPGGAEAHARAWLSLQGWQE